MATASESGVKISEILKAFEELAPLGTAEDWDNVGLIAGDPSWKTRGAVVSVDLTDDALQMAIQKKYRLILNHHPCIFPKQRGLAKINSSHVLFRAIRAGVAVAAYHTNFDRCALEVIQAISQGLKIQPRGRLQEASELMNSLLKLAVFVPDTHVESVRIALCKAGAGHIGNYDFCTFGTNGEGTFRGSSESKPFLGKPGRLEKVNETKLETILPRGLEKKIIKALMKSHPYEEVAYDLYPVEQGSGGTGIAMGLGYGFWGEFRSPKPFSEVAKDVKSLFNINGFLLTEPPPSSVKPVQKVKKLAFVAGKGTAFVEAAASLGCDLFITGETGYHSALSGARRGMAVLELGHRESERFFVEVTKSWLTQLGLRSVSINAATQKIWAGGMK